MNSSRKLSAILICIVISATAYSQRYAPGEIVSNFSLTDRATGQPVSLSDFEGKIVFLEWFAYWCPFCQAAAEQTKTGIVNYYETRQGNPAGIPVVHVAVNLEPNGAALTQSFINTYGLGLVLNDFDRAVAGKFQSSGQPIFAIINGVANSDSHQQWELLYTRLGYGDTSHPISTFRQAIDSVTLASVEAPSLSVSPESQTVATGSRVSLSVLASGTDLAYQWHKGDDPILQATNAEHIIESASEDDSGSYFVNVSNSAGSIDSDLATLTVRLSANDFISQAGLSGDDALWQADPDFDGFANIFEYLAQTDPRSPLSRPETSFELTEATGAPAIRMRYAASPKVVGIRVRAQFWSTPAEAGMSSEELPLGASIDLTKSIPPGAQTYLGRLTIEANP